MPGHQQQPGLLFRIDQVQRPADHGDALLGSSRVEEDRDRLTSERPGPMPFSQIKEEGDRLAQELEGDVEPALTSSQGGLQIQENRLLEEVTRPSLDDGKSLPEGFLGALEVGLDPAGVADIGPGARPQVLQLIRSVTSDIQEIGDSQRQPSKLLPALCVLDAPLQAPLDRQLEETPGAKALTVAEKDLALLAGALHQLGEQGRRFGPLVRQEMDPACHEAQAPLKSGVIALGHRRPERHHRRRRIVGTRRVDEPGPAAGASAQVLEHPRVRRVQGPRQPPQHLFTRMDLQGVPPFIGIRKHHTPGL